MICLSRDIVWVRDEEGRLTPFDAVRLSNSIKSAATVHGLPDWWLADALGQAVREYIVQNTVDTPFIDAEEMATVVASVLRKLGYPDIAKAYQHRQERAEIHLGQLENGLELEFYRELDTALSRATGKTTRQLRVTGLRHCVMRMRGAQRWSNGCRQLAEEIIEHVRKRVVRLCPNNTTALHLAVVE